MDSYSVMLDFGRKIYLKNFITEPNICRSLLEGAPTIDLNLYIISERLKAASERPWNTNKPILIPPKKSFERVTDLDIGFNPQLYDSD